MRKIKLNKLFLGFYLFCFIYQPNFSYLLKIDNYIFFLILTVIFFISSILKEKYFIQKYIFNKQIFLFIILNIFALIYFAMRNIIASSTISLNETRIFQGIYNFVYLLAAIMINEKMNSFEFDKKKKIKFLFNIILIQSLISLLMLVIPSLKNIAINIFNSTDVTNLNNVYIEKSRLYGICNGDYTFGLQIIHGIFGILAICYAYIYKEKKYYFYSILFLLVTVLNGRSGILLYIFGIILLLVYILFHKAGIIKIIYMLPFILILGLIGYNIILKFMPSASTLLNHGFQDILETINGGDKTETAMLINMIIFPTGLNLIFGCGYRILGGKGNIYNFFQSSDIGFVNDLFMGGLLYCLALYYSYFNLYKNIYKISPKRSFERLFIPIFLILILLTNIKGEVFRQSIFLTTMIFLPIILGNFSNKKGKIKNA